MERGVGQGHVGQGGHQRRKRVDLRAHLLGDRVNEPDVQVLLRADACRGGDRHRMRATEPLPAPQPIPGMRPSPGSRQGPRARPKAEQS